MNHPHLGPANATPSAPPALRPRWTYAAPALVLLLVAIALPASVSAQQTYFNVPNAETAAIGEIFLQSQLTLSKSGDAEVTVDVGVTDHLELGFNVATVSMYQPPSPESSDERAPTVLANAQWTFELSRVLHAQVGTWQGIATGPDGDDRADYAGRGHAILRIGERDASYGTYVLGGYAGTRTVLGPGSLGGGMLGLELPLWEQYLRFAGDWVIGTNAESVAAVGLEAALDAEDRWELSVAAQLPSPRSGNDYAFIVQISHIPLESSAAE